MARLIAACEARGVTIDGLSVLEIWLAEHGQTKRNRDEIRRQVRAVVGDWCEVDLRDVCTDTGFSRWAEIE